MQIGELAAAAGVPASSIRFYEKQGLLEEPKRAAGGYRSYEAGALETLHLIKAAKAQGFTLSEIRQLLQWKSGGLTRVPLALGQVRGRIAAIDACIAKLQVIRDALDELQQICPIKSCSTGDGCDPAKCCLLSKLSQL